MNIGIDQGPASEGAAPSRLRRRLMLIAQIIGAVLLIGALLMVFSQRDVLVKAWGSLRTAPAWIIVLTLLSPLANWACTSVLFYVLTNQYARVRFGETAILMGSTWLLNLLPMRPGLIGRVAYQRVVNGLAVADSVKVTIYSVVTQLVALGMTLSILGVVHVMELAAPGLTAMRDTMLAAFGLGTIAALFGLAWAVPGLPQALRAIRGPAPMDAQRLVLGVAVRLLDSAAWTGRYWLAFAAIGPGLGIALSWSDAVILAAMSQAVGMTPVQFGLREWATGLLTRWLPSASTTTLSGTARAASGVSADLLMRAAELIVSVPVGLVCTAIVLARLRKHSLAKRRV